jgi:hypothetical protein
VVRAILAVAVLAAVGLAGQPGRAAAAGPTIWIDTYPARVFCDPFYQSCSMASLPVHSNALIRGSNFATGGGVVLDFWAAPYSHVGTYTATAGTNAKAGTFQFQTHFRTNCEGRSEKYLILVQARDVVSQRESNMVQFIACS